MAQAKYSGFIDSLLAEATIAAAFPDVRRRQVNVLKEDVFPLLAVWMDRSGRGDLSASDDKFLYEATFIFLVAAKLADGESQDKALGSLLKVIIDAAEKHASAAGVEIEIGDQDSDNNADSGDGSRVWASFAVTLSYLRARGDY